MACFSLVASAWTSTMTASATCAQRAGVELPVDGGEGIVERVHEEPAHDVDDENACAVARLDQVGAAARRAGRVIHRPEQPRLALDEDERLALVPGMVAERDGIGARGQESRRRSPR